MNDFPAQVQVQENKPPQPGPSRFIPVILLLAALVLVILSAVLTRRANEERFLLATQTGQFFLDAENTRIAATPLATP